MVGVDGDVDGVGVVELRVVVFGVVVVGIVPGWHNFRYPSFEAAIQTWSLHRLFDSVHFCRSCR